MKAIFHSYRKDSKAYPECIEGCKTALVIVKNNEYELGGIPIFISAAACKNRGYTIGDLIDLGHIEIVDMVNKETGEIMRHKASGNAFKTLKAA